MIIAACYSYKDNSHVVEFLINIGADPNLQNNVSINYHNFKILIITFNLYNDIYYNILHMQVYILKHT